jgi:amino acid adenylation domain-containing protein
VTAADRIEADWLGVVFANCEALGDTCAIEHRGQRQSYRQLGTRISAVAAALAAAGAGAGDVVAVLVDDPAGLIACMLAIVARGAIYAPLDPSAPAASIERWLAHLEPALVLKMPLPDPPVSGVLPARAPVDHDRACYIYFTSGSTGEPKGIVGRCGSVGHFIRWEIEELGIGPECRVSQLTAPMFDPWLRDVLVPLCSGGRVCIPPERAQHLSARELREWMIEAELVTVHCVPSLFDVIMDDGAEPGSFASLRHVLLAGEPLRPARVRDWRRILGEGVAIINLYGASETTMVKFFHRIGPADFDRGFIPIGVPMPGCRAILLNEGMQPVAKGATGELYLSTPHRSLGYYRRPDLTRDVFIANPFRPDSTEPVYRTGDLARLHADGVFEFAGRRDQQVKIRGARVDVLAIEAHLSELPNVRESAAIAWRDSAGAWKMGAFVTLQATGANEAGLRAMLASRVPEYMVPSFVRILERIPLTANGKADRELLRLRCLDWSAAPRDPVAPRTPLERALGRLWSEATGAASPGVRDTFFELGGDSLRAMRLAGRIEAIFQVAIPLKRLFEEPTIEGLIGVMEENCADPALLTQVAEVWLDLHPADAGCAAGGLSNG